MKQNYIIFTVVIASSVALASSAYLFHNSEQDETVAQRVDTAMQTVQEPEVQFDSIEAMSFIDIAEIEPEIVVDKAEDMLPPGIAEDIPHDLYDGPQTFWEVDENDQGNDPEIYALNVDPKMISNLQVGQIFDFYVPELNQNFQTDINVTKNSFNGTHIFKGEISDGSFGENVSIVRGKNLTFVTVATLQGVYSATIDNVTGKTSLQSEASLNKNLTGDDGIEIEVTEVVPPEMDS